MAFQPTIVGRVPLRDSTLAIGTSYDTTPAYQIRVQGSNCVMLQITVALNTATSAEVQVEFATPLQANGTNLDPAPVTADWFARSDGNYTGRTITSGVIANPMGAVAFSFAASGTYEVVLYPVMAKWLRVKAKTTGGPGTTTVSVTGVTGMA